MSMVEKHNAAAAGEIELSIVIPCYNEEEALPISMPPLIDLFWKSGIRYEMVMVNNGSWDATPKVIDSFISQCYPVQRVDVSVNQGWGWGVISGLQKATGKYVAYMTADSQITADDVIRTFQAIRGEERGTIVKIRRVNHAHSLVRWLTSKTFNLLFRLLFGAITDDVDGTPKFFYREDLQLLKPTKKDSFLDAEMMIKAKFLKYKIVEVPVSFHKRRGGRSTVRIPREALEFLRNMIQYRWGNRLKDWKAEVSTITRNAGRRM